MNIKKVEDKQVFFTEQDFWDIVSKINWRFICSEKHIYNEISAKLTDRYTKEGKKELSKMCYHFSKALCEQLNRYSKANYSKWIDFCKATGFVHGLSDDSEWYLCTFIVGCGKQEYDKVMLDPMKIAEFKDYQEGFSYCFN